MRQRTEQQRPVLEQKGIERSLSERLELLGISVTRSQRERLVEFGGMLVTTGRERGVIGKKSSAEDVARHLADSLSCLLSGRLDKPKSRVVDIGSGGGLPGVPLAIARPGLRILLVDAVRKKIDFLLETGRALRLGNLEAVWTRVEDLGRAPSGREAFDVAVARAVGRLSIVEEYGLPLLRVGGALVAQKARLGDDELAEAAAAACLLGGDPPEVVRLPERGLDRERYLVVVRKERHTPDAYPRRRGIPSKRPLGGSQPREGA